MIEEKEKRNIYDEYKQDKIDIRALMTERLNFERKDRTINFLLSKIENESYVYRDFNLEDTWSPIQKTYFIESLLLRCEIQAITLYVTDEKSIIIEGLQRVRAIQMFFNNELVLKAKGLKKLHCFANKRFCELPPKYQDFLLSNCHIKMLEYTTIGGTKLTKLEEEFIQKQIYIRYNTGIQLKPFEIQKAQFLEEIISKKIKILVATDENLFKQLQELKVLQNKKSATVVDKAMVRVRELITSTYCPLSIYFKLLGANRRINEGYIPYVKGKNVDEVVNNFTKTIHILYEIVISENYSKYEELHTRQFIESTYWLFSTILKDKLVDLETFDYSTFINYCHQQNSSDNYFLVDSKYTGKDAYQRYTFLTDFMKKFYSIDMERYFKEHTIEKEPITFTMTIEELQANQYTVKPFDEDFEGFSEKVINESYIFQPPYQREEVINIDASSGIIESAFCKIAIPDILVYRYYVDGTPINEIVDGQQRCLTVISYMGCEFLNENKELKKSNKHKFALGKMRIFKDYTGKTYHPSKTQLPDFMIKKLRKANIHIACIDEHDNPNFDACDHYVRINSNSSHLIQNSFMMWSVSCDRWVVGKIMHVVAEHRSTLFKKTSKNKRYEQIVTGLVYAIHRNQEYLHKNKKRMKTWQSISNPTLTHFLEQANDENRAEYLAKVEKANQFLIGVESWLHLADTKIHTLFCVSENTVPSPKNYNYLYFLLCDFSPTMLIKKAHTILEIISHFYESMKIRKDKKEIINKLQETKSKLNVVYMLLLQDGIE